LQTECGPIDLCAAVKSLHADRGSLIFVITSEALIIITLVFIGVAGELREQSLIEEHDIVQRLIWALLELHAVRCVDDIWLERWSDLQLLVFEAIEDRDLLVNIVFIVDVPDFGRVGHIDGTCVDGL